MHVSHNIGTEPDKSGMALIKVNNEKELRRYNVDEFAQEVFGHVAERTYPIYLVFHHGRLVGYFHAIQQLVLYPAMYPAMHPERMKPRELIKIIKSLVTEAKRLTGNPLFMLCDEAKKIGPKGMRLMRLKKAPEEAYVYTEE